MTIPDDVRRLAEKIGSDPQTWVNQCHVASLEVVQSGLYGDTARVARGSARGVGSQHSWVALGDPYNPSTTIIDPTLWCYSRRVTGIWEGTSRGGIHSPHGGKGNIWEHAGKPPTAQESGQPVIELEGLQGLSDTAKMFMEMIGDLGSTGWMLLFNSPVRGWPAAEIVQVAYNQDNLKGLIPIDIVGMLTDHNPDGLYLRQ